MLSFLDPRVWPVALALVLSASGVSYFKGQHDGRKISEADYAARAVLAANEARKMESLRQARVDEAARSAAAREARLRADAAGARRNVDSLRGTVDAVQRHAEESADAARKSIAALSDVFQQCSRRYSELAEIADRHANDTITLQQAWPTN